MNITLDQVRQSARKVVAEFGEDYVYEQREMFASTVGCVYTEDNGEPSCIVAHILSDLGVSLEPFVGKNGPHELNTKRWGCINAESELGVTIDMKAKYYLGDLQEIQDEEQSWGRALEYAERPHI
jgi:hypothetical protein